MDLTQNEWQDKEWECYKDPMNMLFGWCCALCMVCDTAKRMGESVPKCCCCGICCPMCTIYMLRKNTREKYGIEGDTMKDVLFTCCLGACVNCQVNKEVKKREPDAPGLF